MAQQRYKLRNLRIGKVSLVDRPAQEGAKITFAKRREDAQVFDDTHYLAVIKATFTAEQRRSMADSGEAMSDGSYPIRNAKDLSDAVASWGRANPGDRKAVATHIKARAAKLGLTDTLPTSGPLAEAMGTAKRDDTRTEDAPMADEKTKDLEKQVAEQAATIKRLEALASLSAAQRAHHDALPEAQRDAFLAKSATERDAEVRKSADADPVVYTASDGTTVRKSQDPTGLIAKALREADEAKAAAMVERNKREQVELEKRATEMLPHTPGTAAERAALLKAAESIPDKAASEAAVRALKAGDAAMAGAYRASGGTDAAPPAGSPQAELAAMVNKRAAVDKVPYAVALKRMLDERDPAVTDLWDRATVTN